MAHEDIAAGRLEWPEYDLAETFVRAQALSAAHAAKVGTRSLDLLHVAAALEAGCPIFASFDERPRRSAQLAGLVVVPT